MEGVEGLGVVHVGEVGEFVGDGFDAPGVGFGGQQMAQGDDAAGGAGAVAGLGGGGFDVGDSALQA